MFKLIKKDIMIIRKPFVGGCLALLIVPVFLASVSSRIESAFSFLFMAIMGIVIIGQAISAEEADNQSALAVLCSTPYRRRTIVHAKYVEFLLLFSISFALNELIFCIFSPSKISDLSETAGVWLLVMIVTSVYLPLEIRYGADKTKYFYAAVTILISSGSLLLSRATNHFRLLPDIMAVRSVPAGLLAGILILLSAIILMISMELSARIFCKKDL